MMQITVEYSAQVKRAARTGAETLQFSSPPSLHDVVQQIVGSHGEELRRALLDENGSLHPSVLVFVGDSQIRGETDQLLADGNVVSFLSPISGG